MPLIRCPHCGEDTFTIAGWADLDHCASCGRPLLGRKPPDSDATIEARQTLGLDRGAGRARARTDS